MPVHLEDGEEQRMPLGKLIAFGESLFVARFTTEDGLGRPQTKGTGAALSDPASLLVQRRYRSGHAVSVLKRPDLLRCTRDPSLLKRY